MLDWGLGRLFSRCSQESYHEIVLIFRCCAEWALLNRKAEAGKAGLRSRPCGASAQRCCAGTMPVSPSKQSDASFTQTMPLPASSADFILHSSLSSLLSHFSLFPLPSSTFSPHRSPFACTTPFPQSVHQAVSRHDSDRLQLHTSRNVSHVIMQYI